MVARTRCYKVARCCSGVLVHCSSSFRQSCVCLGPACMHVLDDPDEIAKRSYEGLSFKARSCGALFDVAQRVTF